MLIPRAEDVAQAECGAQGSSLRDVTEECISRFFLRPLGPAVFIARGCLIPGMIVKGERGQMAVESL